MLQAIVLGIVQGLTEFLPVSSSGHLVIVPFMLGWEQPPLAFDVAMHLGTIVAVIAYFARDLWWIGTRALGVRGDGAAIRDARRLTLMLALATVPAAVVGASLEGVFEETFGSPRSAAVFLLGTAALLVSAERIRRRRIAAADAGLEPDEVPAADTVGRGEESVGWRDALTIGGAQALAILPGISRSGATIAAGMVRGLSREGAARFSFLLSIPIILGAGVNQFGALVSGEGGTGAYTPTETLVGALAATVSGYWAIRFLLRLVATDELTPFAWYVGAVSLVTLAVTFVR